MLKSGVPLDVIPKTAAWSKAATFQQFYDRPVGKEKKTLTTSLILKYYAPVKRV